MNGIFEIPFSLFMQHPGIEENFHFPLKICYFLLYTPLCKKSADNTALLSIP
jgi:hypothetical protein